jgi:hypothetical protein
MTNLRHRALMRGLTTSAQHLKGMALAKAGSVMLLDGMGVVGQDTQPLHYGFGDAELRI